MIISLMIHLSTKILESHYWRSTTSRMTWRQSCFWTKEWYVSCFIHFFHCCNREVEAGGDGIYLLNPFPQPYTHSGAALRIISYLDMPLCLMYSFVIVPPFLRDCVYNIVGKYRYAMFGKYDVCVRPDSDVRARFLDWQSWGGASQFKRRCYLGESISHQETSEWFYIIFISFYLYSLHCWTDQI